MPPYGCSWIPGRIPTRGVACVLTQIPAEQERVNFGFELIRFVSADVFFLSFYSPL